MGPGQGHTGPKMVQNRKNRNQKIAKKSMEKIAAGPIVAAIYSEVGIRLDEGLCAEAVHRIESNEMP